MQRAFDAQVLHHSSDFRALSNFRSKFARDVFSKLSQGSSFWDSECIPPSIIVLASKCISDLANPWVSRSSLNNRLKIILRSVCVIAVDATPSRAAAVPFSFPEFSPGDEETESLSSIFIDLAELKSIGLGKRLAKKINPGCSACFFIGDNIPALLAAAKGRSSSLELENELVAQLLFLPDSCFLGFIDIPTDSNYADIFTRPARAISSKEKGDRLRATREAFFSALHEFKLWPAKNFFSDRCSARMEVEGVHGRVD